MVYFSTMTERIMFFKGGVDGHILVLPFVFLIFFFLICFV